MRLFFTFVFLWLLLSAPRSQAADITTLSGKKYLDVRDISIRGDRLVFSTATDIVRIPLSDVPPALIERYKPKPTPSPEADPAAASAGGALTGPLSEPLEDTSSPRKLVISIATRYIKQIGQDMEAAATGKPVTFTPANAFSADQIETAKNESLTNGRSLAFFLLDESLFNQPADPTKPGAAGALAQWFQTFNRGTTVVFVVTPRDLGKLPPAVSEVLKTPAPVSSLRIIFTNAEASLPLFDLAMLSESWGPAEREKAVVQTVQSIKRWYADIANDLE